MTRTISCLIAALACAGTLSCRKPAATQSMSANPAHPDAEGRIGHGWRADTDTRGAAGAAEAHARAVAGRAGARQRRAGEEIGVRSADPQHRSRQRSDSRRRGATKSCETCWISSSPTQRCRSRPRPRTSLRRRLRSSGGSSRCGAGPATPSSRRRSRLGRCRAEQLRTDARVQLTIEKLLEAHVAEAAVTTDARSACLLREKSRQVQTG